MLPSMTVQALSTRIFRVGDDLVDFILAAFQEAQLSPKNLEGTVLAVSTKIVSLAERQVILKSEVEKLDLIKREADTFVGALGYGSYLTIKEGLLLASAGIDESNAEDEFYILYPRRPFESAAKLRRALCERLGINNFGILLSDSRTTLLRRGVSGVAVAHSGFFGVENKVGAKDLFGRTLKMTQINVADALASAAVFCMGESDEQRPISVLRVSLRFADRSAEECRRDCIMEPAEDLYWSWLRPGES